MELLLKTDLKMESVSVEGVLFEEIVSILERNKNERYLKYILNCAISFEEAMRKYTKAAE